MSIFFESGAVTEITNYSPPTSECFLTADGLLTFVGTMILREATWNAQPLRSLHRPPNSFNRASDHATSVHFRGPVPEAAL